MGFCFEELNEKIVALCEKRKIEDDHPYLDEDEVYCTDEYFGGNIDDAFHGGREIGEGCFACEILELIKEEMLP